MQFINRNLLLTFFALTLLYIPTVKASDKMDEIDSIRAELNYIKDKNTPQYQKNKQKLQKLINQSSMDYSTQARLSDIQRLIQEQKYEAALYELDDFIENETELSIANELLGDICINTGKPPSTTAKYYKLAIQHNQSNISASYKLSKLYLREKRNILGLEYLRQTVENTNDISVLDEIEDIIKNKIKPQNRFEANIMYETLGIIYQKTNRENESYECFFKAIQLNPGDIFLKYYLAELLYANNLNKDAISIFNSILNENPKDTQIRASKAWALFKEGNVLGANKEYLTLLEQYPTSKEARYGIYKIYENKIPSDKILEKVNENKKDYKVNSKECLKFARFLEEMEDYNAADNYKKLAIKLQDEEKQKLITQKEQEQKQPVQKPQSSKDIQNKTKIQEQKQAQLKNEQEAKKLALQKQKEKEQRIKKQKEELQRKEQEKQAQLKKQKEEQLKKEQEKQAQIKKQKEEQLRKEQERQAEIKKQKEREQKLAELKTTKKYKEYKSQLEKYEAMTPKTAQIYTAIGNTYKQMGEHTFALENYKEAIKLDPTNSDLRYSTGLVYLELNSPYSAKAELTKSINLNSENTKAKNLLAFVNQKIITDTINSSYNKFEQKDYVSAMEILEQGLKSYPQNAQMYYYRALVYDAMDRNAAQIFDLQKAIDLDPSYQMAYYQLGKAYEKINDERSALFAYEKFLSTEPEEKDLVDEIQKKVITLGVKYY